MGKIYKVLAIIFAALTICNTIENSRIATDFILKAFFEYDEDNK